jgi:hypothetical protein
MSRSVQVTGACWAMGTLVSPLARRLALRPQFEVFRTVVAPNAVLMVDRLPPLERSPQHRFHYQPMLQLELARGALVDTDGDVAIADASAGAPLLVFALRVVLAHALYRAEAVAVEVSSAVLTLPDRTGLPSNAVIGVLLGATLAALREPFVPSRSSRVLLAPATHPSIGESECSLGKCNTDPLRISLYGVPWAGVPSAFSVRHGPSPIQQGFTPRIATRRRSSQTRIAFGR